MAASMTIVRALNISSRITRSFLSDHSKRCLMSTAALNKNEKDSVNVEDNVKPTGTEQKTESVAQSSQDRNVLAEDRDKLAIQVQKLEEDLKETKDKYVRSLAETENLRRRMMKQVEEAKLFGIQGFCKDLLDVSDILTRAISSVPKEELKDSNPHLVSLYQGLNMTDSQLTKVFHKHGLESISPQVGDRFDPNFHEALFQVPLPANKSHEPETVAIIQKIGYKLHNRTLRPALVGVFKAS